MPLFGANRDERGAEYFFRFCGLIGVVGGWAGFPCLVLLLLLLKYLCTYTALHRVLLKVKDFFWTWRMKIKTVSPEYTANSSDVMHMVTMAELLYKLYIHHKYKKY